MLFGDVVLFGVVEIVDYGLEMVCVEIVVDVFEVGVVYDELVDLIVGLVKIEMVCFFIECGFCDCLL